MSTMFNSKELNQPMAYLRDFWECLISVGVDKENPHDDDKYKRFTNVVAVLTSFAVAAYIPQSIYTGYLGLAAIQLVDTLFVLSVLWFSYKNYHKTARHVYVLVINSFVIINSCYIGYESRVHDFFYISYVVPFLLFSVQDYKHIVVGVLVAIISFNIYQQIYPYFTAYNVDLATQLSINNINTWMKFVLFGVAIYILAYYNYSTEMKLAESNRKLQIQAEELQRSNEDLEQFAYVISHDLKAPVRNIGSFMNLLLTRYKASNSEDAKELITLSKQCAERLSKQIDDLLSYCKVGRNLPPAAKVDLNKIIHTIQMELGERIADKRANVSIARNLPSLTHVHPSMIHHVFQNLIANGIKFNNSETPTVVVDFSETDEHITYIVRDNGIGMDIKHQDNVFQMFKRLHTSDQFEGTGIGLAVCKKIVNFYKGEIWFESELGKGTTIFVKLMKEKSPVSISIEPVQPLQTMVPALEAA